MRLRSLRARSVALLAVVVVVGQILSFALIWALAIRPQAERVGAIMARNVAAISMTLDTLAPPERQKLIDKINAGGSLRILPGNMSPPEDRGIPTLIEQLFIKSFAREMQQRDVIIWRGGLVGQLWVHVRLGGEYYWISYERPKGWSPTGAMGASFLIAVSLALFGGILLQRRIARPLKAIAAAADDMRTDGRSPPLDTDGPIEIASVARSFNHMQARLAAQEAERTFMLAGISHDLRTPLAKIRLALAMVRGIDEETDAMLARQFDQMDQMLTQFLDFARGQDVEPLAPVDLVAMVGNVAAAIDVTIDLDAPATLPIVTTPAALERAIANLIRNAAKYGSPPFIAEIGEVAGDVRIAIIDHGRGVPPELLATLAQPFVRGAEERTSDGGTGLGLAIVGHIALSLGGSLQLANRQGGGFIAEMRFPRVASR